MAPSPLSRRSLLASGGVGLTLLLAACSTGPAGGSASSSSAGASSSDAAGGDAAFPRSIEHVYGTTEILSLIHISEPTRLSLVSRMPSSA